MGPRPIDLDLLFVDDLALYSHGPPELSLPHPRVAERKFVLLPLADIVDPEWRMPVIERTVSECLRSPQVRDQKVTRQAHLHCRDG